jgi:hypothetical protein
MSREPHAEADLDKFKVEHNRPSLAGEQGETVAYGQGGEVIDDPAGPACLAKSVKDAGTMTSRHFVKFSNVGPTAGGMLDPAEETDLDRRGDWTPAGRFTFRPVTKLAFDLYVRYLKTGNRAYLRQAEREVTL